MVPQHQLTTLISDHHRTRVGIPRYYEGHDRGISDSEALDALDTQLRVADDVGVAGVPHAGGAAVVPGGGGGAEDVVTEGFVAGGGELFRGVGQAVDFNRSHPLLHARGQQNLPDQLDGLKQAVHVLLVPAEGIIDQRVVPDVARSQPHGARALLPGVVHHGHQPDQPLDLRLHHGRDQELGPAVNHIPGGLQPGVRVELGVLPLKLVLHGLHRPPQRIQAGQEDQFNVRPGVHPIPLIPLLVLVAFGEGDPVQTSGIHVGSELLEGLRWGEDRQTGYGVILQVAPDARQVRDHRDAKLLQVGLRPNGRQHQ
mmetsp:Transcript_23333/g.51322  ORF Transcript_23333/g.51322 Transcript_23333/m.51322 type:complete len:312 (+) Transcript_23333:351-1286(+)